MNRRKFEQSLPDIRRAVASVSAPPPPVWEVPCVLVSPPPAGGGHGVAAGVGRREPSEPPGGITGGNLTVSLDWVNATFPVHRAGQIRQMMGLLFGAAEPGGPKKWYARSDQWASGAFLAWSDDRPECWLSLSGDAVALCGCPRKLLADLVFIGAKFTRVDLAVDDHARQSLRLDLVEQAAAAGDVQGFRRVDVRRPVADLRTGRLEGHGIYFGRRGKDGSGKFLRFYDKGLESGGKIDAVRLECEFTGKAAVEVVKILMDEDGERGWRRAASRLVIGAIDFRERRDGAHGHVDRMPRLGWWQAVWDLVGGGVPIVIRRVVPTLQACVSYFRSAYSRRVAQLRRTVEDLGMDGRAVLTALVEAMIRDGDERLGHWHPGPVEQALDVSAILA